MSEYVYEGTRGSRLVAELALRLHREDGISLRIDVPAEAVLAAAELPDGCQLVDATALQFDSLVARNVFVARAAFEELRAPSGVDADALFEHAYRLWRDEIGHSDQASGRLLALASVGMDVLTIGAQRIRNGLDVFDVLHLVEAALPYLQRIEAPSIIDLFVAKYEPTKNDMAGGAIHGAIESWLERRPGDALDLHAKVLENLSEATASLMGNAIVAIAKTDYARAVEVARGDANSGTPCRREWASGR